MATFQTQAVIVNEPATGRGAALQMVTTNNKLHLIISYFPYFLAEHLQIHFHLLTHFSVVWQCTGLFRKESAFRTLRVSNALSKRAALNTIAKLVTVRKLRTAQHRHVLRNHNHVTVAKDRVCACEAQHASARQLILTTTTHIHWALTSYGAAPDTFSV